MESRTSSAIWAIATTGTRLPAAEHVPVVDMATVEADQLGGSRAAEDGHALPCRPYAYQR